MGVMNVEDARAALESKTRITAGSRSQHTEVMEAADALGDARELRGHVGACVCAAYERDADGGYTGQTKNCGDDWYCPDAPVKEVTHDT